MPTRKNPSPTIAPDVPVGLDKNQVRRVAIIGGGASGAIVLDSLVQQGHFDEIVLFERRPVFGGIWVFDDKSKLTFDAGDSGASGRAAQPQIEMGATPAHLDPPLQNPFHAINGSGSEENAGPESGQTSLRLARPSQQRFEETPAYERMRTNVIENMMTFSDRRHWHDEPGHTYVDRAVVQQYIADYIARNADHAKVRIITSTTVEDIERIDKPGARLPYKFRLTLRKAIGSDGGSDSNGGSDSDEWSQQEFDSVVVCTGHYHIPFIPSIPGGREVQKKYPEVFQHAKFFYNGRIYKDKTVVVVGSRASGVDLTKFTSEYASRVYQVIRSLENTRKFVDSPNVEIKPVIERLVLSDSGFDVVFSDGSKVSNPDHIIFATGYQFSYPFLISEYGDITSDGAIVPQLYQHTFLINDPLVSFVGVPTDAISFRAFEFQAILVARYLAGLVQLPSLDEQKKWISDRYNAHGRARAYHTIGALEAKNYMDELTRLGHIKGQSPVNGRQFPITTEAEVQNYKDAAISLAQAKLWD